MTIQPLSWKTEMGGHTSPKHPGALPVRPLLAPDFCAYVRCLASSRMLGNLIKIGIMSFNVASADTAPSFQSWHYHGLGRCPMLPEQHS